MPTGYTADLYEGKPQTFTEFALRCARNFGATITMRDDSLDAAIPDEFRPSDYHAKKLAEARVGFIRTDALDAAECLRLSEEEHSKLLADAQEAIAKSRALASRYEAMLAEVEKWEPPTPDHQGLKDFMRDQLREAIRFDGDASYWQERVAALRAKPAPSGEEWRAEKMREAAHGYDYHHKEHREEIERTNNRNLWVRALRESLSGRAVAEVAK